MGVCMIPCDGLGAHLGCIPALDCSQERLELQHGLEQDEAVTKCERLNVHDLSVHMGMESIYKII